jgi:hypothetical protein
MTANGLALYYLVGLIALVAGRAVVVPWAALAIAIVLAARSPATLVKTNIRALSITLPLVGWLTIIWLWVAPSKPDTLLLYRPAPAEPAWVLVAALGLRFFVFALLTLAAVERASRIKPSFLLRLAIPRSVKLLLLTASSMAQAFTDGVRRAHTALVAAGVVTSRRSLRNFLQGWLLIRTSWVSALGLAAERTDTKWRFENLPDAVPLAQLARPALVRGDLFWVVPAIAAVLSQAFLA